MAALEYLVVFGILLGVVAFVLAPVRQAVASRRPGADEDQDHVTELADLEAARDAKYRELSDADLDHRTGKLSDADYEELDRALRGEAIAIMHDIDRATIEPE